MKYKGEKCVACDKVFTVDDDVVVCPECGSPHHRECYKAANKCANSDFHAEKKKWRPSVHVVPERPSDTEIKVCPACRFPNFGNDDTCARCGKKLGGDPAGAEDILQKETDTAYGEMQNEMENERPFLGFNPNEDMGGATLKEVTQFVCTNTIYYIPIFKHMKDFGSKISFNLSCLIFPYFYFANRKMWGWAVISAIISIFFNTPSYILWLGKNIGSDDNTEAFLSMIYDHQSSLEILDTYFGIAGWITSIIFCLFGNWLYYRHTIRHIRRMKDQNAGDTVPAEKIISAGGVKPVNILIMAVIMGGMMLAALFGSIQILNAGDLLNTI
jgi:DNA-directed RNA polymerase subunit RPC12/RpoP